MMSRRHFMGSLVVTTAACGLGLGGALVARRHLSLSQVVPSAILPLRGTDVLLRSSDGSTLRGVVENVTPVNRPARIGAPGTEQISLLVAGDFAEAPTGAYCVETDDVTLSELVFMAVGGTGRERRLEAVITRIV